MNKIILGLVLLSSVSAFAEIKITCIEADFVIQTFEVDQMRAEQTFAQICSQQRQDGLDCSKPLNGQREKQLLQQIRQRMQQYCYQVQQQADQQPQNH